MPSMADTASPSPPVTAGERLVLLLAGFAAINWMAFGRIYLGEDALYFRDALINHIPYKSWFLQRILAGELPLWSENIRSGIPYLADPVQGFFYPGQIPLLFSGGLHPVHAYGILAGFQFLIAHAGYHHLTRILGAGHFSAFTGSALLAYGPIALELTSVIQFLSMFAVTGWLCAALVRLLRNPGRLTTIRLALWTAIAITTGDLQGVYLFGLVAITAARPWRRAQWRTTASVSAALAAGALLSACAILPGLELSAHSYRRFENTEDLALRWSWNPRRAIEWAGPGLFDPPAEIPVPYGKLETGPGSGHQKYWFPRGSPGLLFTALIPLALATLRRRKEILPLTGMALLFLIAATGTHTGLYQLLRTILPGWDQFRFPERLLLPAFISLAVAGILALDQLIERQKPDEPDGGWIPPQWVLAGPLLLTAAALWGAVNTRGALAMVTGINANGVWADWASDCFRLALAPVVLCLAGLTLWRNVRWTRGLLAGAVVVELLVISLPGLKTVPLSTFRAEPELVRAIREIHAAGATPSLAPQIHVQLPPPPGNGAFEETTARHQWETLAHNIALAFGLNNPEGYNSSAPADREMANRQVPAPVMARILALDFAVLPQAVSPGSGWTCGTPLARLDAHICRPNVPPGAVRAPPRWIFEPDPDQLRKRMQEPGWNPASLEFIGRFSGRWDDAPPVPSGESGEAAIRVISWTPERRVIEVEREKEGPTVFRDNFFPGWKAFTGGQELSVIPANGFQIAVWTPAGKNTIELVYQPRSVAIGAVVSIVTALGLLVWAAAGHRRKESTA